MSSSAAADPAHRLVHADRRSAAARSRSRMLVERPGGGDGVEARHLRAPRTDSVLTQMPKRRSLRRTVTGRGGPLMVMMMSSGPASGGIGASRRTAPKTKSSEPLKLAVSAMLSVEMPGAPPSPGRSGGGGEDEQQERRQPQHRQAAASEKSSSGRITRSSEELQADADARAARAGCGAARRGAARPARRRSARR